ncbi:MAG: TRAP transporter large permease, partial [Candidatus Marithrix sp.]
MSIIVLVAAFACLLALGVPIAFAIGLSTFLTMLVSIDFVPAVTTVAQRMAGGINSFALLAIPLFILSGQLMNQGGIANRLVEFAKVIVGTLPGGLAFVNIVSCTLFGAISGSAVAATSGIGSFMIPAMEKEGYPRSFNSALTAAASTTGLLIPPSNVLIVYAVASGGVSISALFIGGYVPGVMVALGLMLVSAIYAKRYNFPRAQRITVKEGIGKTIAAMPSLFLIVFVIGGILAGIFTATEAGAIAVVYSLFLSTIIYKQISLKELPSILIKATETTAIAMLLVGTSMAMSWVLAYENIPALTASFLLELSDNPIVILLLINIFLLL